MGEAARPVGFLTWLSGWGTARRRLQFKTKGETTMRKEYRYGKKVRQLREERGWTQEHLAAVAGIESVRTVQRVEKGETKNLETLQAIANGFDVELAALRDTWRIAESRLVRTWPGHQPSSICSRGRIAAMADVL